ncbi:MAG: peptidase [Deltaproteobacteria bacterium]|jgi:membrane dipeptidase|nr:MAG: peptidase [Deltaproteobacteria bacterium]
MIKDLFIVDAHEDIAYHLTYFNRDFVTPSIPCMITLPWLKQGKVKLVFNTVFVPKKFKPAKTLAVALHQLAVYESLYKNHCEDIYQVKSNKDIINIEKNPRIGFITLMEGADPIEHPKLVNDFYEKGIRIIGPAWNDANQYASGNETGSGLTYEGKELIKRMNDLGIILDLSHLNERCFWESLEICKTTPIASHSNARELTDHPRNLKDEQLRAISERGGVIGIALYNEFLKTGEKQPTLEDIFAHIDYMVNLCGEDHVGIGSDLDGANIDCFPKEIRTVADLPLVADFLIKKGYSEKRVRKIMGENFLRVLRENLSI